jgi:hypothetical protein
MHIIIEQIPAHALASSAIALLSPVLPHDLIAFSPSVRPVDVALDNGTACASV